MLERRPFHKFNDADSEVWSILYERQFPQIEQYASKPYWLDGLHKLQIKPDRIPDFDKLSQRLQSLVGWELFSTEQVFSDGQTWFEHLSHKQFLISEYIREKKDLDYTPLPDIFHDAFGHLPLMANPRYTKLVHDYSFAMLECNPAKRKGLGSIWWYTIEFGLIEEEGQVKVMGAGLASSFGELQHAYSGQIPWKPFDPEEMMQIKPSPHHYHDRLYVLESFEQLENFLHDWIENGKGA